MPYRVARSSRPPARQIRRPGPVRLVRQPDRRTALHLLNRTGFGPRPGDLDRVQAMGLAAYIDQQLHPEQLGDLPAESQLAALTDLEVGPQSFAADFYLPMIAARQDFTNTQKTSASRLPRLGWHLQPIAAMSLPGAGKPVSVVQQNGLTPEEVRYQRENQAVLAALQSQKLLRAVYSERQLQEVLVDFWFNHFNVDARKIEDQPVVAEYERDVIRPRVFGRFRDLLGATAKSPAMLFYLDNWLSSAPPAGSTPGAGGRGVNENYARELMELHTLGVNGGYTQADIVDVARCFTGWTMRKPHEATGFEFNPKMHDRGGQTRAWPHHQSRRRHRGWRARARSAREASCDGALHRDGAGAPLRVRRSAAGARDARGENVPSARTATCAR